MGGSAAAAAGPVLGGARSQLDWRLIFFLNLPTAALALTLLTRADASARRAVPLDWTGQTCAVLAVAALTYAVIEGGKQGYGSAPIRVAFVVAIAASAAFLAAQALGRHPMVPLEMFRSGPWLSCSRPGSSAWPAFTASCSCRACTSSSCAVNRRWSQACFSCR